MLFNYEMIEAVSVIGLGKLGVALVATYLHRGFSVIGMDVDPHKVNTLSDNLKKYPLFLTGRLETTNSTSYAVLNSNLTIIIVNTPKGIDGSFSLEYVLPACEAIGEALKDKKDYHVIVLSSTVMPGTTGGVVLETLEKASGKRCGKDFGLCHVPEFLALGSAINDLLQPDFVLIGEYDQRSGNVVIEALSHLCENNPPAVRTSVVNAELAKLAHNCFLITKIKFANHWAQICEAFERADIDIVTSTIALSHKISPSYLTGSIGGVEGPCFPRDVKAWIRLTQHTNVSGFLPDVMNDATYLGAYRLIDTIKLHVSDHSTIGILGLAYKPDVPLILNSLGLMLAALLPIHGFKVIAHDPMARPADQEGPCAIPFTDSLEDCVERADCLVITTAWDEFRELKSINLDDRVIIDCWRMFDDIGPNYIAIGRGR